MKLLHLIFHRRKQSRLAQKPEGFAIAPILYLLGLIGVGAGVLFSGYSQILRSNQTMSNTMGTKNDLQGTATTLAASSWMATDGQTLCPPMIGTNASANCTGAAGAMYIGTSFANATAANLPANYNSVTGTGGAAETGVFKAGSGAKVLDPWGHYYIYCRWENRIGANNALMVISGGANGKIETTCASTVAGGDDLFVVWTTAVTQNRASVWQTVTSGTTVTGVQYGATGSQLNIDTSGDVTIPGTLGVTGATTLGTNGLAVSGPTHLTGSLSATSGTFSSSLGVTGTTTLNGLSAGTSVLSSLTTSTNAVIGGTLGVSGASSLGAVSAGSSVLSGLTVNGASYLGGNTSTSTGVVNIGTTVVASGSSTPLLTVGKPVSNVYPFYVDQFGGTYASSFNGSLNGSQSGGSVSATSLAASGAATLGGTLAVTGATTLTGAFTSNSTATATFAGAVTATSFNGNITIGSGGSGVSFTGVIPIANGGTGASTSSTALSNLLSGNLVPASNVGCCIQTSQLSSTGIAYGTYSSVTVGTDGRVISGVATAASATSITDNAGDSVTVGTSGGITYTIGNSVQGNWTGTGLMVGSSKPALDKLDVYGATAIGTGYAGITTAPSNGLIVQGQVAIGTSTANGALNVNGTVTAIGFSGSGAGLTNIGTSALSGTVSTANGGTGTNTVFTQGSVVYSGAGGVYSQDNSNFFYDATNHRLGLGTAAPQTTLAVNGTTSFMLGADYTTTGSQADVSLGAASTVRYNGGAVATFYGIVAGKNGQIILLHNASSYILTLSNLSASESTTNNQIITGTGNDVALQSNSSVILQYDSAALKWRIIGGSGGGGQGLAGQAAYYQTTGSAVVGTSSIYIVNGNVGIGTANPQNLLHVNGTLHMTGVTGGAGVSSGTGIVGGTSGQVQFNGGTGAFSGDPNLFWDNTDKWLGIGTSAPMAPLQVDGTISSFNDNGWSSINDTTYGATYYGAFRGYKARGSAASPTAVQNGDVIVSFDGYGYDSSGFNTAVAAMQVNAASTWTGTSTTRNGYLNFWTAGSGTLTERMRIDQSGNVGIGTTSPSTALVVIGTATATSFAGSGASLTNIGVSNLGGITGTASSTTFLRGDGTWTSLTGAGAATGTGTANYTARWTGTSTLGTGTLYDNGSNVGIGTTGPRGLLEMASSGGYPSFAVTDTTQGANSKTWDFGTSGGTLNFRAVNDAYSSATAWLSATRSGTTISSVVFPTGNIGIGTTSPINLLDVNGSALIRGNLVMGYNTSRNGEFDNNIETGGLTNFYWYNNGTAGQTFGLAYANSSGAYAGTAFTVDKTAGAVTFSNNVTVSGTLNISGSNSLYFSSYGGGWYMSDSTWIRSAGSKNVYMSNGFDTGSASGVNCGGGLGNGYTFDVCGSANVTGALSIGGAFSPASISMNGTLTMNRYTIYLAGNGDTNHAMGNGLESYNSTSDGESIFAWQFFDIYSKIAGHSAIFVNGSGNVGINNTGPGSPLDVNGNINSNSYVYANELYSRDNVYLSYMGNWISAFLNQSVTSGSSPNFWNPYIGYMGTNLSNWVNQSVCNGCNPTFGNLYLNGQLTIQGTLGISGNQIWNNGGFYINYGGGTVYVCWSGGCSMQLNGDMYAHNYYHNSDRHLKNNIKPAKGLEIVDRLNGVTFTWKEDGKASAGVIAQDVQAVLPEAVSKTDKGFLAVSYDSLFAPVIEAIKELHAQILALAAKVEGMVAELQNHADRIAKLESENSRKDAEIKALQDRLDKLEAAHK